jgi:hypothetical protein
VGGLYGRPRHTPDSRFIRNVGVAILAGGVLVFALWFGAITGLI